MTIHNFTVNSCSFTFSRAEASGSRRRAHFEAAQLQGGRRQEGRMDPRIPAEVPQTRRSRPFGRGQVFKMNLEVRIFDAILPMLPVRLRKPVILPVARPKCEKSLRMFRE